jgi:AcrR family transcriptional regulator
MSLEEVREQNKRTVIEAALACFLEQGIEQTKISEIARRAELTERSIYRYFETKADLVLASALLFWDDNQQKIERAHADSAQSKSGTAQIYEILCAYADLFFTNRREIIFVQEAEGYLNRNGKSALLDNKPPTPYESSRAPLANAIRAGIADGSVKAGANVELLYYNTYDALLGLLQKMAMTQDGLATSGIDARERLNRFCRLLTASFEQNL